MKRSLVTTEKLRYITYTKLARLSATYWRIFSVTATSREENAIKSKNTQKKMIYNKKCDAAIHY